MVLAIQTHKITDQPIEQLNNQAINRRINQL
jgi:hypothetical protein